MGKSFIDAIGDFQYREASLLFVFFLFVNSSAFYKSVLSKFDGTVDVGNITSYGVVLQGLILVAGWYIISNMLSFVDSD